MTLTARHRRRAEVPPHLRDHPRHTSLGQNAPGWSCMARGDESRAWGGVAARVARM